MRSNADSNRSVVVWTKSIDDESSTASFSSARKPSEISLIPSAVDSVNGELCHDSMHSLSTSKVYQPIEQRSIHRCATNEPRRSKSRVRTYLKRCKDAIIGTQTQIDAHPDQSNANASLDEIRPTTRSSTSSWYVNEMFANRNESSSSTVTQNVDSTRNVEFESNKIVQDTTAIVSEEISNLCTSEMDKNNVEFVVSDWCLLFTNLKRGYDAPAIVIILLQN